MTKRFSAQLDSLQLVLNILVFLPQNHLVYRFCYISNVEYRQRLSEAVHGFDLYIEEYI